MMGSNHTSITGVGITKVAGITNMNRKTKSKINDWCMIIGVSAFVLFVVITVMLGVQAIVIDTGRAILR